MDTFLFESKHPSTRSRKALKEEESLRRFSRWSLFPMLFFLICLLLSPWTQTSRSQGRLLAYQPDERVQRLEATIDGRVIKWFISEGQHVQKGEPIVLIADNDKEIIKRLTSEHEALIVRYHQSLQSARASQSNLERQKDLFENGLSSKRAYELSQIEYSKNQVDVANSKAEIARLDVKISRQEAQSIVASKDGYLIRIHAGQGGEMVKMGELLASFMPDTEDRIAEVFVSGNEAPLIRSGQEVRLQFEGWPSLQISGWPSLAIGSFGGEVFFVDLVDSGKGDYRVLIRPKKDDLWPSSKYLRQGGRVTAWIFMNRVTVGFELWRKFNAFPVIQSEIQAEPVIKAQNKH